MSKPIDELVSMITTFPGIGPRQARRVTQFLLSRSPAFLTQLSTLLQSVQKEVMQCRSCFRYDDRSENGLCKICMNPNRDDGLLMVVEKDVDIEGVESSGAYRGRYFVLGGLMPLAQKKNAPTVRVPELISRIKKQPTKEVILALSTTPEGDYTAREIAKEIASKEKTPVSMLARGLSVGAEIEYADSETLRNAFRNRS